MSARVDYFLAVTTVPPLSVHSFSVLVVNTWPLQEFFPLQALSLPPHAPWPPQLLSCLHSTFALPVLLAFSSARAAPVANNEATAEAITAPFNVSFSIFDCSFWFGLTKRLSPARPLRLGFGFALALFGKQGQVVLLELKNEFLYARRSGELHRCMLCPRALKAERAGRDGSAR